MKKCLLLITFLVSFNSLAWDREVSADRFDFHESYIESLRYNSKLNKIISIIDTAENDFSFKESLIAMMPAAVSTKEEALSNSKKIIMHTSALNYRGMEKISPEVKATLKEVKEMEKKYKALVTKIEAETTDHVYIERMNCKQTGAECYETRFDNSYRTYRLPFFGVINYLIANFDEYENNQENFKQNLITEFNIKEKMRDSYVNQFNCWKDDCDQKMVIALDAMLERFYDFVHDQLEFRALIESRIEEIAKANNLEVSHIISNDKFGEDFTGYPHGKFSLNYSVENYTLDNSELDLNPITKYLQAISFEDLISIAK
jgi:hypothetical protein